MNPRILAAGCLLLVACRRHSDTSASSKPPPPRVIEKGIEFQEVTLSKFPERPRLWIYVPKDGHRTHPCVFIAAPGAAPFDAMTLTQANRAEHLPYVRAGYAVVAYDVSGKLLGASRAELDLFAKRKLGLDNGRAAIDYATGNLSVDPLRFYVAGRGGAGTLALQLLASETRLRGGIAYSPVTDVPAYLGGRIASLDSVKGLAGEVRQQSPMAMAASLRPPVAIFDRRGDGTTAGYVERLKQTHGDVTFSAGNFSGYEAMIRAGLAWLERGRPVRR